MPPSPIGEGYREPSHKRYSQRQIYAIEKYQSANRETLLPDGIELCYALFTHCQADARKPSPMGEGGFERSLTGVKILSKTDEALPMGSEPSIPLQNAKY